MLSLCDLLYLYNGLIDFILVIEPQEYDSITVLTSHTDAENFYSYTRKVKWDENNKLPQNERTHYEKKMRWNKEHLPAFTGSGADPWYIANDATFKNEVRKLKHIKLFMQRSGLLRVRVRSSLTPLSDTP